MYTSGQSHRMILDLHLRYGDIVRVAPDEVSFSSPDAWKDIMGHRKDRQAENVKDPVFFAQLSSKGSIIRAPREDHPRIRSVVAPGFSAQSLMKQEPIIRRYVDLLIRRLMENSKDGKEVVDMVQWCNYTTFDIIGDLAFGEPFGCLETSSYHFWVALIFDTLKLSAFNASISRFPWISRFLSLFVPKELVQKRVEHVGLATAKVKKRLSLGATRPDFMSSMAAENGGTQKMSFEEIRGTSQTLIVAGSETTATALSAALFFLTSNPQVLNILEQEIRSSFQSDSDINFLSTQKLPYMLAVINETLRMHPPVPIAFPRRSSGGMVCGYYMPEGTILGMWQWPIYRNPRNFTLPDDFVPERWLGDPRFVDDRKDAFQPFSFGTRNCIGKNLAFAEMRIILARIIWNFDIALADDSKAWDEEAETFSLWHKGPLNMHLKPVVRA
ncbi:Isotrichodermin C-15 hydroxylase [Pleurostoma richardsiae]|uniref:Isotrichodermin C-15 hydroxylase n=1 Tax=Pleurostoma richardsiae TaxID=41990 RepID=A0AA38VHQ0_9PEZI|nr:Isotrichodermin C-15 hydroxylase [Pleurostoma richardsiae]